MKRLKEEGNKFWGLDPSDIINRNVKVTIDILEDNILDRTEREKKEAEMIKELQPILQINPKEKAQNKNGASLRIDQYIPRSKRKGRVSEAPGL